MHLSRPRSIPPLRPLRPPNYQHRPQLLRPFTQRTRLLLVSPSIPRAQLPFLSTPVRHPTLHVRLSRLLSTETKRYLKDQTWLAAKYSIYIWLMLFLFSISLTGIWMERWDRLYPAPKEWSTFLTKLFYQKARNAEDDGKYGSQASNWARIGSSFREARKRLEDLNGDGKGLVPQNDSAREGVPLSDVGEVGFDVTSMSEEWIRGYHYVLLHA